MPYDVPIPPILPPWVVPYVFPFLDPTKEEKEEIPEERRADVSDVEAPVDEYGERPEVGGDPDTGVSPLVDVEEGPPGMVDQLLGAIEEIIADVVDQALDEIVEEVVGPEIGDYFREYRPHWPGREPESSGKSFWEKPQRQIEQLMEVAVRVVDAIWYQEEYNVHAIPWAGVGAGDDFDADNQLVPALRGSAAPDAVGSFQQQLDHWAWQQVESLKWK